MEVAKEKESSKKESKEEEEIIRCIVT